MSIQVFCADGITWLHEFSLGAQKAECIFLDPPFNTGKDWIDYKDSYDFTYWKQMIRDVSHAAKDSLSFTGIYWVNVDETYSHHVRMILDDVFSPQCYVATIVWRKKYRAGGAVRGISTTHNPIFAYSRYPKWERARGTVPNDEHTSKYKNPDNDPYGRWRLDHLGRRVYLSDLMNRGAVPQTWWDYPEVGHTEQARKESGMFSTPKPVKLLERIIHISTNPGDLVIDPMCGSGTTLVAASNLGRHAIGIEKEQETIEKYIAPRFAKQ